MIQYASLGNSIHNAVNRLVAAILYAKRAFLLVNLFQALH